MQDIHETLSDSIANAAAAPPTGPPLPLRHRAAAAQDGGPQVKRRDGGKGCGESKEGAPGNPVSAGGCSVQLQPEPNEARLLGSAGWLARRARLPLPPPRGTRTSPPRPIRCVPPPAGPCGAARACGDFGVCTPPRVRGCRARARPRRVVGDGWRRLPRPAQQRGATVRSIHNHPQIKLDNFLAKKRLS